MPNEMRQWMPAPRRWNDAEVYGSLEQAQPALSQQIAILSRPDDYTPWLRQELKLEELVERHLSRHIARSYDMAVPYPVGEAILFADAFVDRRDGTLRRVLDPRRRQLASLGAIGIQIYGHLSFATVVDRLREFGHLAIAYTMHLHGMTRTDISWPEDHLLPDRSVVEGLAKERGLKNVSGFGDYGDEVSGTLIGINHDPVERFRIILPLRTPFPLNPESYREHVERWSTWSNKVTGFARNALGLELDPLWCRPDLIFPLPGHLPDAEWGLAIVAGPAVSVDQMP